MRALIATSLACAPLIGCNASPQEPAVTVEEVRVTLPAIRGRPGAAYFTLRTNNDPTRLVGITSPDVDRIELHDSMMHGAPGDMRPAGDLVFDDALAFTPGGKHAMLFGIDPAVQKGATIPLTFHLEPMKAVTVEAEVHGPGEAE